MNIRTFLTGGGATVLFAAIALVDLSAGAMMVAYVVAAAASVDATTRVSRSAA